VNLEEQVARLLARVDVLEARVKELEHENYLLRVENAALKEQLRQRDEKIVRLEAENADLRMQLRQNSNNSSKPPSSDPPWKKPPPEEKPSEGNKRGGQKGHKGNYRTLVPVEEVDAFIDYAAPERCRRCSHDLKGVMPETSVRMQVTELPEPKAVVHEHRAEVVYCPNCGQRNAAEFPKEVERPFGPRLMATVALLSGAFRMSKRNVQELLLQLHGVPISLGAISNCEAMASQVLAAPTQEALAYVQQQAVAGADETSWKEGRRHGWLWVFSTALVSVFLIQARRTAKAAQALLGNFAGVLEVDRFGGYRFYQGLRQFCWAHLKRDFRAISESEGPGKLLGLALLEQTRLLFRLVHRLRDGTLTVENFQSEMKTVEARVESLLDEGRTSACKITRGKCKTLWRDRHCLWTFVKHPVVVEPTNNRSERDLRHAVIARKTSYGTQSERGSRFIERMLTVVKSLKAQHRNIYRFLLAALDAKFSAHAHPSLLPSPAR
jgi:transposase